MFVEGKRHKLLEFLMGSGLWLLVVIQSLLPCLGRQAWGWEWLTLPSSEYCFIVQRNCRHLWLSKTTVTWPVCVLPQTGI